VSDENLLGFLRHVAARADLLDTLKTRSMDEVTAIAEDLGYPFTKPEFDTLVWDLEQGLATTRGENFDPHFSLWQTMWGKYYLEYLVHDLIASVDETEATHR
jgi:hypothetical protein